MPDTNKIEQALREIAFCDELKVKVADGVIIAICKGRYSKPERSGVKTEVIIENEITR